MTPKTQIVLFKIITWLYRWGYNMEKSSMVVFVKQEFSVDAQLSFVFQNLNLTVACNHNTRTSFDGQSLYKWSSDTLVQWSSLETDDGLDETALENFL